MKAPLALVGIGKIALDQHVPALAASPAWQLAATVSRRGEVPGIAAYKDFARFLAERPEVKAISLCLPPGPRFAYAAAALQAGRHVMLEKPPGASLAEVQILQSLAARAGVTLYASWHSRMGFAVPAAKAALQKAQPLGARIIWHEDVRRWHPGQDWVFDPGGMGVFDPGINALSILTAIWPAPLFLQSARLTVPANRQMPIAAALQFSGGVSADFDWRIEGPQRWDIEIETAEGPMALRAGGAEFWRGGACETSGPNLEYPRLYARFAELVAAGQSEVDLAPMVHVADAFALGARESSAPFTF